MSSDSKLRSIDDLIGMRAEWKRAGKIVVWTNGCFDLIHAGHVRSLRAAKKLGDILIVGLNSDASVRSVKGPARPLVPERDRAEIVAAFESVDYVTVFDDFEPTAILSRIRPDVHCKGAEYAPGRGRAVPERDTVLSYGGRIEFLPVHEGRSTSALVNRIVQAQAGPAEPRS